MALNRKDKVDLFGQLKTKPEDTSNIEKTDSKKDEKVAGQQKKSAEKQAIEEDQNISPQKEAISTPITISVNEEETITNSVNKAGAPKNSIAQPENNLKVKDFGLKKERVTKKIRKQFVLTEKEAEILKATAKYNGMSENQVIEYLINSLVE